MQSNERDCTDQRNDNCGDSMCIVPDGSGMGKEERKAQVLKILHESDLALTPYVLFKNLKFRGATFERRTLGNYLNELISEGKIEKLEVDGDPLYQITDTGRAALKGK